MPFNLKEYKNKRARDVVMIKKESKKTADDRAMNMILPGMQMDPYNQKPRDGTQAAKIAIKPPTSLKLTPEISGSGFIFRDVPRRNKAQTSKNIKLKL